MSRAEGIALLGVCAGAAYFVAIWMGQAHPSTAGVGYDLYQYYFANMLYLASSERDGFAGLLWNPYQACGKAWLAVSSNGALYPLNLLYLVLSPSDALLALTGMNLVVAGTGMFFLCRQLGTGVVGAACGALAFQLGNMTAWVTTWTPIVGAAYAWTPLILLCCERILRRPTAGGAIALGAAATLAFLPGHPQVLFHVYQLIGLRIMWELVVRGTPRPVATLACVASGLVLPAFIGAVQLLPAIELAQLSIRSGNLSDAQIGTGLSWAKLGTSMAWRVEVQNPADFGPLLLVTASLLRRATRRYAVFYLVAGILSLVLAFGHATPLFDIYLTLPSSRMFRMPQRFLWVTGLSLAILAGLGADALVSRVRGAPDSLVRRIGLSAAMLVLFGAYAFVVEQPLPIEWALALALSLVPLVHGRAASGWVAVTLVVALCASLTFALPSLPGVFPRGPLFGALLRDPDMLIGAIGPLRDVRARMTPQDRAFLVDQPHGYHLMPKAASMVGLRSIDDYEAQPTRRHAAVFSMMRSGRVAIGVNAFYMPGPNTFADGFRRRLLDLQAVRWIVAHASVDWPTTVASPPLRLVATDGDVRIYENPQALPRAYWVPRVKVGPESGQLLSLANGKDDLRHVALLGEMPPDGFLGSPHTGEDGQVTFMTDAPTHVTLRVEAPARGFLVISDSYYPGWHATVDGRPTPILPANHAFRAVEVPQGISVVDMRFRPISLFVGAGISATTLLGIGVVLAVSSRRRCRESSPPG